MSYYWIALVVCQVFYLKDPIDCSPDTQIKGTVAMLRQEKNKRLYDLHLTMAVDDGPIVDSKYEIP